MQKFGEQFNKAIVNYLKFARCFSEKFPGFETDVHGLVIKNENGVKKYYVDCVKKSEMESKKSKPSGRSPKDLEPIVNNPLS